MKNTKHSISLIPSTYEVTALALNNNREFCKKLNASTPVGWPTAALAEGLPYVLEQMPNTPESLGWWIWWIVLNEKIGQEAPRKTIVGNIGFKGVPNKYGIIELTFSIMPEYQNRRIATSALKALIMWANSKPAVKKIIADTKITNLPTQRLLKGAGFTEIKIDDEFIYELVK